MTTSRPRSVAVRLTSTVADDRIGAQVDGVAAGIADDLAHLPVEEDPVVELAAPAMEIGIADQPADLRKGRLEGRAVDGDPTAARTGALDDLDPAVLGRRPVAGGQRGGQHLEVDASRRATLDGSTVIQPPPGSRAQAVSSMRAAPAWPSRRSVAT